MSDVHRETCTPCAFLSFDTSFLTMVAINGSVAMNLQEEETLENKEEKKVRRRAGQ